MATIWDNYYVPMLRDRGLTAMETFRAKRIFIEITVDRQLRGLSARETMEAAEKAILPYIKPRGWEAECEKCDFCGRPHVDNSSQCPGCGVWRKQYR